MGSQDRVEIFEVKQGKEVHWPEESEGATYETVCLRCPDGWKRSFRVDEKTRGVAKNAVGYHVRANQGHQVRVTYSLPASKADSITPPADELEPLS